jgi:hypothetical protein
VKIANGKLGSLNFLFGQCVCAGEFGLDIERGPSFNRVFRQVIAETLIQDSKQLSVKR